MPLTKFKLSSIADGGITEAKLATAYTASVKTNPEFQGTEAARLPVGTTAQREGSPKTGDQRFNSTLSLMEYYDGSQWKAIDSPPVLSSFTPTSIGEADSSQNIVLTGSNFHSGATVSAIGQNGSIISAGTVVIDSTTQITATFNGTSFSNAQEDYDIKVTNPSGLFAIIENGFSVNQTPTWSTAAGSLMGSNVLYEGEIIGSLSVAATDPDGDVVSYAVSSGDSLPSGLSLNSSTGAITGDPDTIASDTTSTFDIEASDTADNVSTRTFSMVTTNDESAAYEGNLKLWLRAGWDGQTSGNQAGNTLPAAKYQTGYGTTGQVRVINSVVLNNDSQTSSPVNGTTKIKDAQGGVSGLNTVAKQTDAFAYMMDASDSIWTPIASGNSVFDSSTTNHTFAYWLCWENRVENYNNNNLSPVFHSWAGTNAVAFVANDWYMNNTGNPYMMNYAGNGHHGTWNLSNVSGGANGNKGVWHHISLVFSSGQTLCYLNGSLDATIAGPTSWPTPGSGQACNFNGRADGLSGGLPDNYSTGDNQYKSLADIRYYNTNLSAGVIAEIYNKSRSSFL